MYVCGPTVSGVPHLGHGRFALVFDVLRRYLEFTGVRVHYVSNITDIDDKIIERAKAEGRSEEEVAGEFEAAWWEAMDALGVMRPTESPHATAWVAEMVSLVSELIDRQSAYVSDDGVYLSVERIKDYGLLAHQSLSSLLAGARVEIDEHKRSLNDFALWKNAKPGEPSWDAPFGRGRPGWHTECVVMSLGLLGDGFDLHCGGLDLVFPHHENERGAGRRPREGLCEALGAQRLRRGRRREDVQIARELHVAYRPARTVRLAGVPAPGTPLPLSVADRGHPVDGRRRRSRPRPAGQPGEEVPART